MNNGLVKGKIYSSSDKEEKYIYRVIAFVPNSNQVFVVNCRNKTTRNIDESELENFDEISEEHMIFKTIGRIQPFSNLSKEQKKVCRDRYNMISSLLINVEKPYFRAKRIENISKIYNVSKRFIERLLNRYLAYGRIESLIRNDDRGHYSLKPVLKEIKYDGLEMPGNAILTKTKLQRGYYLYLLYDSFSKYIYSYSLSNKEKDYGAIKTLILRCNAINGHIPSKINTQISTETWCSYYRNLQCCGVDIRFCRSDSLPLTHLNDLIKKISNYINDKNRLEEARNCVKQLIDEFNTSFCLYNETPIVMHRDALPIFKDSFLINKDSDLLIILSNQYKKYYESNQETK